MSNILNISDAFKAKDSINYGAKPGPYVRTKIIAGYDPYVDKRTGVTKFGTKVFETENMIVLGGSLFTLEKVFGVDYFGQGEGKTITNDIDINTLTGIATGGPAIVETFPPKNNVVCLFGVGISGAGESITDVKDVKYYERTVSEDGIGSTYGLIPFRQTADPLLETEVDKYWFKKSVETASGIKTAYYLKSFETKPEIFVLYRDNGDDDGSAVTGMNGAPWITEPNKDIETFIQLTLKVTKKDVREFFTDLNEITKTRINTIALFTGVKAQVNNDANNPIYDYKQVRMFSKLNINNEMLTASKDLTISYRIYTS